MQQLVSALQSAIESHTRIVHCRVEQIERAGDGYRLRLDGQSLEADQVIVATPAYGAGDLLRALDGSLAELLSRIRYHSSITVALGYDRAEFAHPLNGFGFLVPRVERDLLTACTWVGTKFPHRVPENRALLRVFIGAGANEDLLEHSDDWIVASAKEELSNLMGVNERPVFSRVHRWRRAMAQYTVGHERRLDEIKTRLAGWPGLHLAGNAYLGIGVPDCIHTAQLAAQRITGALAQTPPLTPEQIASGA